jgi:RHS repeat-associated protein
VVKTESGQTIEYGKTEDARQVLGGTVLAWYINRVTDRDGNYMTYHYGHEGTEIWLQQIIYTGNDNAGLQPYAVIDFNYLTGIECQRAFVAGHEMLQRRLLSGIQVNYVTPGSPFSRIETARGYWFNYAIEASTGYPLLSTITLVPSDGNPYKPTVIEWEHTDFGHYESSRLVPLYEALTDTSLFCVTGDFIKDNEEDGYIDIVSCKNGKTLELYKTYRGSSETYIGFEKKKVYSLPDGILLEQTLPRGTKIYSISALYYKDLVPVRDRQSIATALCSLEDTIFSGHLIDDHGEDLLNTTWHGSRIRIYRNLGTGEFSIETVTPFRDIGENPEILVGDVTGEGYDDILLVYKKDKKITIEIYSNEGTTHSPTRLIKTWSYSYENPSTAKVRLLDFDGNGKKEILLWVPHVYYIYEYAFRRAGEYDLLEIKNGSTIRSPDPVRVYEAKYGDFNGDKITDMLWETNGKWFVSLGTGTGYTTPEDVNSGGVNYIVHKNTTLEPVIMDINGDGMDDIIGFQDFDGLSVAHVSKSKGYRDGKMQFIPIEQVKLLSNCLLFGDFNNDSRVDMMVRGELPHYFPFANTTAMPLAASFTDGMGNTSRISYMPFYAYSCNDRDFSYGKMLYYLAETISLPTGHANRPFHHFSYSYDSPRFSTERDIFQGFHTIKKRDETNGTSIIYNFSVSSRKIMNLTKTEMYAANGNILNTTVFTHGEASAQNLTTYPLDRVFLPFILEQTTTDHYNKVQEQSYNHVNYYTARLDSTVSIREDMNNPSLLSRGSTRYSYTDMRLPNGMTTKVPDMVYSESRELPGGQTFWKATAYKYNDRGQLMAVSERAPGSEFLTIREDYNYFGQPRLCIVSAGNGEEKTSVTEYDPTGRFAEHTINTLGHETFARYDKITGHILTSTDINGLTTAYEYDATGRCSTVTYPDGTRTFSTTSWYSSTAPGLAQAVYKVNTRGTGNSKGIDMYFDRLGREVSRRDLYNGNSIDTRYDDKGLVEKTSLPYAAINTPDENKLWYTFEHDSLGRLACERGSYTDLTYSYGSRRNAVRDNLRNTTTLKTYDYAGRISTVRDPGGMIEHAYGSILSRGMPVSEHRVSCNGSVVRTLHDSRGNRLLITDPDAGTITSAYDAWGRLAKQTDARGVTTSFSYDLLDRLTRKEYSGGNEPAETITYEHDYDRQGCKGKLYSVSKNGTPKDYYLHDNLGRLERQCTTIDDKSYWQSYTYDDLGRLATKTFPDGFALKYGYNGAGDLLTIKRADNDKLVYNIDERNYRGQPTLCFYGNNTGTRYTYNDYGLLTGINVGVKVLDLPTVVTAITTTTTILSSTTAATATSPTYSFSATANANILSISTPAVTATSTAVAATSIPSANASLPHTITGKYSKLYFVHDNLGRIAARGEVNNGEIEYFTHDGLDRLSAIGPGNLSRPSGAAATAISYLENGNITGAFNNNYLYQNDKPHAVSEVTETIALGNKKCETSFNIFNRIKQIKEDNLTIDFFYNVNNQREKMVRFRGGEVEKTKIYASGDYEIECASSGERHLHYIHGVTGIAAIYVTDGINVANGQMYNIATDHLGSITLVMNEAGKVVDSAWYDPWGNRVCYDNRGYHDNSYFSGTSTHLFDRGFCGHEHIALNPVPFAHPQFSGHAPYNELINMNARLYDPTIARFLSPDPYVQLPDNTQSYNRYSYCMNSPLMYTDPSGNSLLWAITAFIVTGAWDLLTGNWQGWNGSGKGAVLAGLGGLFMSGGASVTGADLVRYTAQQFGNNLISKYGTITIPIGNTSFSFSPGLGFNPSNGLTWAINLGVSQQIGEWNIAANFGAGTNFIAGGGSVSYKGYGAGYYMTSYGNAIGPDGKSNAQLVGGVNAFGKDFSVRLENDFLAGKVAVGDEKDGQDRYRTNALEIQYKNFYNKYDYMYEGMYGYSGYSNPFSLYW